ncbi:MAG: arginine--tRNA ligase, partial [Ktedonobacteraceae bacterium]
MTISKEVQHTSMDMSAYLTAQVSEALKGYLAQEELPIEPAQLPIVMRFSAQASFGDYSMPVMAWTKQIKRPPMVIAEALAQSLRAAQQPAIDEITVTKPGFLNFRLNRPTIGRTIIEQVLEQGADFGQNHTGQGERVIVEHTNINSNKAAHVGHLRNACLGDTAVRMLRTQGYEVEANNYIDDTGVQVADVVVGFTLLQQGKLHLPEGNAQHAGESFDYYCSRVYVAVGKAYEEQAELKELRNTVLHAIEHGAEPEAGPDYAVLAADLSKQIVQAHLTTMARLNISYDLLTWESSILNAGLWKRTFEVLRDSGVLEKPETGSAAGCWIVPFGEGEGQSSEGEQRTSDKILVRSNGTATYTGKDIAYQLWKFGLADDPRIGVKFHFIQWDLQKDGHMLWSMRPPQAHTNQPDEASQADPQHFGHAKRVINVIDVRQSYLQQVVYESLRRLGFV